MEGMEMAMLLTSVFKGPTMFHVHQGIPNTFQEVLTADLMLIMSWFITSKTRSKDFPETTNMPN